MGEKTGISWCHHTGNLWAGCVEKSPACVNCYAKPLVTKRMGLPVWGPASTTARHRFTSAWRDIPRWDRKAFKAGERRRLFVNSLADFFEDHPQLVPWRAEACVLFENCTNLDVLLLTKRPENVLSMVPARWLKEWPRHVWVGTTAEDQPRVNERVEHLQRVPAAVRFLSCEPLLEAVDITNGKSNRWSAPTRYVDGVPFEWTDPGPGFVPVDWVIVGGESGTAARPFDIEWVRSIVRQCADAAVPVFVKQDSGPKSGLQGRIPNDLWIKEFPSCETP